MDSVAPTPPYFAVIFTSQRAADDGCGYAAMSQRMLDLARDQPGFLGSDSARNAEGLGITVSYWKDEASIAAWRAHAEHAIAQRFGREAWYAGYRVEVCEVKRAWSFGR
jgi:heme-degrading monooxygenase HmoA